MSSTEPTPEPTGPETPDTDLPRRRRKRDAARRLEVEIRREQVASLLLARVPYRKMAELLGVSKSQIGEDVQALKKQHRERAGQQVELFVTEQISELDGILRAWMPLALNPGPIVTAGADGVQVPVGPDQILNASRAALVVHRALERYSRLLGMDAPVRHELTGEGGGPVRFQDVESARAETERALSEFEQRREQQLRAEGETPGETPEANGQGG